MDYLTGWVKQPKSAGGLDHLGSQAPCINLYGRLLPGITNVTDRARYYSFYPWFFWAYEKEYQSINWEEVVERYRKADCLFTLIAARHANQTDHDDDNHGIAMIGRNTLVKALTELEDGHPLYLNKYSTREPDNPNRYFKNKLGGLGQYYIGTFKELGLLDGDSKTGVKYTIQRAQDISGAMDAGVDRKLFFEAIKNDEISTDMLDALSVFCPCQLSKNSNEQSMLIDLFFDRKNIYDIDGQQRRNTLCLIMHLINKLDNMKKDEPVVLDHFIFRGAIYSGHLINEVEWLLPEALENTRAEWAIYQKNELLSLACQAIFWVVLRMIQESETIYYTSESFVEHFINSESVREALGAQINTRFDDSVADIKSRMPKLAAWENPNHECFFSRKIWEDCSNKRTDRLYNDILRMAIETMLLLSARNEPQSQPYGKFEFPENYFAYYPINLQSFKNNSTKRWHALTLQQLIGWLAQKWGIETHFGVALRKLHREKLNTFKIRPTDEGLKIIEIPEPGFTAPRFRQGLRVLRDLGAIDTAGRKGSFRLTALGRKLMGETIGN